MYSGTLSSSEPSSQPKEAIGHDRAELKKLENAAAAEKRNHPDATTRSGRPMSTHRPEADHARRVGAEG
jgi:hypothetical protein